MVLKGFWSVDPGTDTNANNKSILQYSSWNVPLLIKKEWQSWYGEGSRDKEQT